MKKTIMDLFGIPSNMELEVGDMELPTAEGGIPLREDYVFRKSLIRDMSLFWTMGDRAAMMIGPKGSGKTSAVEQWHAVLRRPLFIVGGHKRMTVDELFGQYIPTERGDLQWTDGMVTKAARIGASVLINEFNAIDPGVSIALNDIAQDGSVVTIPQTGEVINPPPGFRIYATKNPPGSMYSGRQEEDASTRDRFFNILVGFAEKEEEIAMITPHFVKGGIPAKDAAAYAAKMVDVAKSVRARSMDSSLQHDALPETISSRVLVRWARYWVGLQRQPAAVHRALERALTLGTERTVRTAIHGYVGTTFGVPYAEAA